jgi:heat-inducible transcriptional repressor
MPDLTATTLSLNGFGVKALTQRERAVLYAVITDFIATGEPVGSRTLTRKYGFELSPATIRNVLADLEEAGYLSQPHTSAGRVPSEAGFRVYIDALMSTQEVSEEEVGKIREFFASRAPGAQMLQGASHLLSELSRAPAVLLRTRSEQRTVLKIRFITTRPKELLSVIVLSDGTVENRFIRVDQVPNASQLERVHNMLEEAVAGRTLSAVRDHFSNMVTEHADEVAALGRLSSSLVHSAMDGAEDAKEVYITGHSHLLDQPEFVESERARALLAALEDRQQLMRLLDLTLASDQVQLFLGEDTARLVGYPLSLVAAPYSGASGERRGALGIVGPTRMDYPHLVPLVGATAEAMSAALARSALSAGDNPDEPESEEP